MRSSTFPVIRSVGMLVGSVIGVGVFGLPYALSQGGIALGILLLCVMAILLTVLTLMYGEVVLQTPGKQRLVGYTKRYLGGHWWIVSAICFTGSIWGAMLAYLLVGGDFISSLFSLFGVALPSFWGSLLLWGLVSALVYQGLRFASKLEVFLIGLLLFLFVFMILAAFPHVEVSHLFTMDWKLALVPYGVVLFSLAGAGSLPEIKEVLGRNAKSHMGWVILLGMAIITSLYALFSFVTVGVLGPETTQVAFDGLVPILGGAFRVVVALIGSVTIVSIYMILGVELRNTFQYDFSLKKYQAWALAVGVPLIFFLGGVREFIIVVGFAGGVFGSILSIFNVWMYERMHAGLAKNDHHSFHVPKWVSLILVLAFFAGLVSEIIFLVS